MVVTEEMNTTSKVMLEIEELSMGEHDKQLNQVAKDKLLMLCNLADLLEKEFNASEVHISVDPDEGHGVLAVDMPDVVFEFGRSHQFFEYIRVTDFLRFTKTKTGELRIYFGVNDLWVDE